jgi:hypothetical protein
MDREDHTSIHVKGDIRLEGSVSNGGKLQGYTINLEPSVDKNKPTPSWLILLGNIAISVCAAALLWVLILGAYSLFYRCTDHEWASSVGDGFVAALIGALATFVVINNYAQVRDVKKSFESRVESAMEGTLEKARNLVDKNITKPLWADTMLRKERKVIDHARMETAVELLEIEAALEDKSGGLARLSVVWLVLDMLLDHGYSGVGLDKAVQLFSTIAKKYKDNRDLELILRGIDCRLEPFRKS